jgi:Tol biopolymer transport system component/DNA-binding winged helix-turn-helix (wHTH) protein
MTSHRRGPAPQAGRYRFGPFRLDVESRVLDREGTVVPLAPRTFDLLHAFVTSGGRLLTKNELLGSVWGDVNVEEASLAFQVSTLRKALGEHGAAWIETVPKHGYRFTAPVETVGAGEVVAPAQPSAAHATRRALPPRPLWMGVALALVASATLAVVWMDRPVESPGDTPLLVLPLTSFPGREIHPTLSPDGTQVAFAWDGEARQGFDIYVQLVGQGTPVPLTSDPRPEYSPVWSPDGRLIAFCRQRDTLGSRLDSGEIGADIVVVSPQGGTERIVASPSPDWAPVCDARVPTLSWFPSSQALASIGHATSPGTGQAAAVYVVPLGSGAPRRLTQPDPASWCDALPAVSPDGRYLAFTRSDTQYWTAARLHVAPLTDMVAGPAQQLLPSRGGASGVAWIPGSDRLAFASGGLWEVAVGHRRVPVLLPTPGHGAGPFSIALNGERLAFSRGSFDLDIWRMPGPAGTDRQANADGQSHISTTMLDSNPQYSPDGKRIAFTSTRSGELHIWVADADGSNAVQVTASTATNGTPRWSPDGRSIAYDSTDSGKGDIYVIPAGGGPARRVTPEDSHEHVPSWSRDGRWIYFESDRTGEFQLWKAEFPTGALVQVTTDGGAAAFESPDGQWLYYGKGGRTGLWRAPVAGGPEEQVTDRGHAMFWDVYDGGGCVMDPLGEDVTVYCFEFGSPQVRTIARFPNGGRVRPTGPSFSVSPDGRWILYSRVEREESDLMLIENFGQRRSR